MALNLQTLSLPSAEALARQTGNPIDISSKVEGLSVAEMRRNLEVPKTEFGDKPLKQIMTEDVTPVVKEIQAAMRDIFGGQASAELSERTKVVDAKEAQGALQIMQEGDIQLGAFNFSLGGN